MTLWMQYRKDIEDQEFVESGTYTEWLESKAQVIARERDEARARVWELAKQLKKEHDEALSLWIEKYSRLSPVHNTGCCHSCELVKKSESFHD